MPLALGFGEQMDLVLFWTSGRSLSSPADECEDWSLPMCPVPLPIVQGQPSWPVHASRVKAFVTPVGGHLGPVTFTVGRKKLRPFSVAPWAEEKLPPGSPPLLKALRGDFFCMPFGGNAAPYRGEKHPPHGETANATWKLESLQDGVLHASLKTKVRAGRVDKFVRLRPDEASLYQRHVISGMSGPMNFGMHMMLRFRSEGLISTSRFVLGQVLPTPFESAAKGGYQILQAGAHFTRLDRVPRMDGHLADLSRYPARRGYEDLAMIVADVRLPFAWTAVVFPEEGFLGFTLKDPRVLHQTVFWNSNGGRHYAPWNGRHVDVLGMEEVTAYFDAGIEKSAGRNPISAQGYPTSVRLSPKTPLVVNTIFAVAAIPRGFDRVESIKAHRSASAVTVTSATGRSIEVPVDLPFLSGK